MAAPIPAPAPWRIHQLAGITIEAGSVPPGLRFRRHEHEGTHLCCVAGGGFVERLGRGVEEVGPGTVRVSGGARHSIDFGPAGAACVVLHLDHSTAGTLGCAADRMRFMTDDWLAGLVARMARTAARTDPAARIALESLGAELLAQVARRHTTPGAGPPPRWLRRAHEMVHDAPAPLSAIAREIGVHRVHLARSFRDHFGAPIGTVARRVRLERALRLLEAGVPLARVASEAGYADQSHLTRAVSRRLGAPPGRLRRGLATQVQDGRRGSGEVEREQHRP